MSVIYRRDEVTPEQRKRVEDEFFTRSFVRVDWKLQGMDVRWEKGGDCLKDSLHLGPWAGPVADLSNLVHEMCHFVEIDDERMLRPGWGLRVPKVWVIDRYCVEPLTHQMTDRELRVIAFQANVLEYLGYPKTEKGLTRSLHFLPDWSRVPMEDGSSGFVFEEDARCRMVCSYTELQESRYRWCTDRVKELRGVHTLELFMSEWKRRNELLMERHR